MIISLIYVHFHRIDPFTIGYKKSGFFEARIVDLRSMLFPRIFLFILICLLVSCKEDTTAGKPQVDTDASAIEKDYFKDYESPKHKWGFINKSGQVAIKPIYDDLKDIQNNRVAANFEGKWGYLDGRGQKVIDFKYKQAYNFSSPGQTFVQDFENNWLLIDAQGSLISKMPYSYLEDFYGDHAVVGNGQLRGVVSKEGSLVIPLQYSGIKIVSDTRIIGKNGRSYGLFKMDNTRLVQETFQRIVISSEDLIRVKKDGMYYLMDSQTLDYDGSKPYVKVYDFTYDKTIIKDSRGHAVIDKKQKILKRLPYDRVEPVGHRMWKYKEGRRWGLLNEHGETVTMAEFDLLNRYADGRLAYSIDARWGYLDTAGQPVLGGDLALVWDFHDGLARMIGNRGVGFIDTTGKMVVKDMFVEVRDFFNGLARFQTY